MLKQNNIKTLFVRLGFGDDDACEMWIWSYTLIGKCVIPLWN